MKRLLEPVLVVVLSILGATPGIIALAAYLARF